MVTVVDAFLTVTTHQASSTEQKGVAPSEMLRNEFRKTDETISQEPLKEGAKMKPLILKIGAVAAGAALACCLFGCAEEQESIYLPSSMIINYDGDGTTYIESYTYDSRGNLVSCMDSRVKPLGGESVGVNDLSGREEGMLSVYNSLTTYEFDENGIPTSLTRSRITVDGNKQSTAEIDFEIETDETGLWREIVATEDGEALWNGSIEYENGLPKVIQIDRGWGATSTEFDGSGWRTQEINSPNAVFDESTGRLESIYDYSFEYDENNCLTAVYRDGKLETQIDYVLIESPSPSVYALSHLKLDSVGMVYPYGWYWELGGTFLG